MSNPKNKIIFIVGPTAVGKSEIAVRLAQKINAKIISCDSMQIYKKMNVITQKPSLALRRKVKHHLLDIISPEKEYSVADYQREATLKIKDILKRGQFPLLVGGSGFYMSVLLDGIFQEQIKNRKIRDRLYRQAEKFGKEKLCQRLRKVDPQAAAKIHPHDLRRIVRALEIYENTGIPISELQKKRKGMAKDYEVKIFCLNRDRKALYKKIAHRVDQMFEQGLIKEVKRLLDLRLSKTACQAIGIKEIKGYLKGQYDLGQVKRLIERNSRRYAKRQLSWFRRDKRITWINVTEKEKPAETANRLWKKLC